MKFIINLIVVFIFSNGFSQETPNFAALDSLYREDQFYVGITYNALQDSPSGLSQKKFTPSFSFGMLRDMPINKKRDLAFAAGLGYSINNYNQNLLISEKNGFTDYQIIATNTVFENNKLILHYIDFPIEFRWRTSTPESHKFYRIYAGFKTSYLVYDQSKFVDANKEIIVGNNQDFNKLQFGTYLDFGYNGLNFYAYYGINPLIKSGTINNKPIEMRTLNFGLMFYIL
jgi:Outer membrane protein beta-barrel domain